MRVFIFLRSIFFLVLFTAITIFLVHSQLCINYEPHDVQGLLKNCEATFRQVSEVNPNHKSIEMDDKQKEIVRESFERAYMEREALRHATSKVKEDKLLSKARSEVKEDLSSPEKEDLLPTQASSVEKKDNHLSQPSSLPSSPQSDVKEENLPSETSLEEKKDEHSTQPSSKISEDNQQKTVTQNHETDHNEQEATSQASSEVKDDKLPSPSSSEENENTLPSQPSTAQPKEKEKEEKVPSQISSKISEDNQESTGIEIVEIPHNQQRVKRQTSSKVNEDDLPSQIRSEEKEDNQESIVIESRETDHNQKEDMRQARSEVKEDIQESIAIEGFEIAHNPQVIISSQKKKRETENVTETSVNPASVEKWYKVPIEDQNVRINVRTCFKFNLGQILSGSEPKYATITSSLRLTIILIVTSSLLAILDLSAKIVLRNISLIQCLLHSLFQLIIWGYTLVSMEMFRRRWTSNWLDSGHHVSDVPAYPMEWQIFELHAFILIMLSISDVVLFKYLPARIRLENSEGVYKCIPKDGT